jgi:hypothetical protein
MKERNYITCLPEELQTAIYAEYFSRHCLEEFGRVHKAILDTPCQECYRKKFTNLIVMRKCTVCSRKMCADCFTRTYATPSREYHGWCNTCIWMDIG